MAQRGAAIDRSASEGPASARGEPTVETDSALQDAAASPGQPLPGGLHTRLQDALGADLSAVQIHAGPESARSAQAIDANAYTTGQDIHFGADRYDPSSASGERLIAHEVAHTVQQGGGAGALQGFGPISSPGDAHELEAESFAQSFVAGGSGPVSRVSAGVVSRAAILRDGPQGSSPAPTPATPVTGAGPASPGATSTLPGPVAYPDVNYYFNRAADFIRRYPTPPPNPPTYYTQYGDKYGRRFKFELRPTLSARGQTWVDQCFLLLQQAIENRRFDGAGFDALEKNNSAFLDFAYGTHPRAYIDAGLHELPVTDLVKISLTPDFSDILTRAGLAQVVATAAEIIPQWGDDIWNWGAEVVGTATEWVGRRPEEVAVPLLREGPPGGDRTPAQTSSTGGVTAPALAGADAAAVAPGTAVVLPGPVAYPDVNYYFNRAADFIRRYPTPPPSPPTYYTQYGDKYARRFKFELKPRLSARGQTWVDQCFLLLQQAIENRRHDPAAFDALEKNNSAFLDFAYGSHPRAYLDSGLHELPITDLVKISLTPDFSDILTEAGLAQVVATAREIIPQWGDDIWNWGAEQVGTVREWAGRTADEVVVGGQNLASRARRAITSLWE